MDKLAELVRDSEVRGAMAAFVDLGLVKVAGQEAFDALVDAVCQGIGDEGYDLQKVASLTEALLAEPQNEKQEKKASIGTTVGTQLMVNKYGVDNAKEGMSGLPKTASEDTQETDDIAKKAALGELLQMKVAGQIDEKSFVEAASSLLEKDASENLPKKKVFDAEVVGGKGKIPWKRIAKGGAVAAGLAGGAALGKSLYDKYSGKSKEGN
ncbi:hypothetical protein [Desulfovibrio piger]|uniref:hypothetical protein n=1 Tax=Desulfovibrio piger TaxID=901 RepID=UPI0026F1B5F7|nr:hypothetical protein [Desulfovibrio piger]